tara:strand:+ start:977 stop:1450 length:474 start_codon:yes stop_codon:yes gene_type:complete
MIEMLKKIAIGIIIVPIIIIVLPVIFWIMLIVGILKTYIRFRLRIKWPENTFILFTYSESENWTDYIEQKIIPRIAAHAQIINRSQQKDWKSRYPTERRALESWGNLNINPVAIVFRPWKPAKVIAFYEAFRDLKHGKESTINAKTEELFQWLPVNP